MQGIAARRGPQPSGRQFCVRAMQDVVVVQEELAKEKASVLTLAAQCK